VVNDAEQPASVDPGAMLRSAREARDLTQQDVADSMNLSLRVVGDIEAGNWSRLPSAAFSRGYVRAYAKLLGIDPEAMVRAFDAAVGQTSATHQATAFKTMPPTKGGVADLMQKQPGTVLTGAVVLVICSVLVVLWAVWPDVSSDSAAAKSSSLAPVPGAMRSQAPVATPATPTPTPADGAAVQSQPDAEPAPIEAAREPLQAPTAEQPAAVADGPTPARRITAGGQDRLAFAFADDCWVEVKDGQGQDVYSDLSRSGESLELVGQAPFMIMLGYAPGVTLSFNGERVALSPHTRNNVATLALGQ
jgi:cytoskeleton protein RodZ